jgi:hypothetical protein
MEETVPFRQEPVGVSLAVVVGNGYTMDCIQRLGLSGIDVSNPVDWPVRIPEQPELSLRDALPHFFRAYDELRLANPQASQFELPRKILGSQTNEGIRAEVEARHLLTLAYRFYTTILSNGPLEQWRWLHWFRAHVHVLLMTVSFNYDVLLERVLYLTGRQANRTQGNVNPGDVRVFKPHGSVDFDLVGCRGALRYPIQVYGHMNNFPLRIVPAREWGHPPFEPVIVLPHERNPYSNYQWVRPGYSIYKQLA